MNIYAVVSPNGGIVSNLVVGDSLEIVSEIVGGAVEVTDLTGNAQIGYIYDSQNGVFVELPPQQPIE